MKFKIDITDITDITDSEKEYIYKCFDDTLRENLMMNAANALKKHDAKVVSKTLQDFLA